MIGLNEFKGYKLRPFKDISEFWEKSEVSPFRCNFITIAKREDFKKGKTVSTKGYTLDEFVNFAKKVGFKKLFDEYVYFCQRSYEFIPFALLDLSKETKEK